MNGSAPNSPATGSQISVRQKFIPNFWTDSTDWRASTTPIAHTRTTSRAPNVPVPMRNRKSLRDLDSAKGGHLELDDGFRQRRVAEIGAVFLTLGQRPLHEVSHRLCLRLVLPILVQQDARGGADRTQAF